MRECRLRLNAAAGFPPRIPFERLVFVEENFYGSNERPLGAFNEKSWPLRHFNGETDGWIDGRTHRHEGKRGILLHYLPSPREASVKDVRESADAENEIEGKPDTDGLLERDSSSFFYTAPTESF